MASIVCGVPRVLVDASLLFWDGLVCSTSALGMSVAKVKDAHAVGL